MERTRIIPRIASLFAFALVTFSLAAALGPQVVLAESVNSPYTPEGSGYTISNDDGGQLDESNYTFESDKLTISGGSSVTVSMASSGPNPNTNAIEVDLSSFTGKSITFSGLTITPAKGMAAIQLVGSNNPVELIFQGPPRPHRR